jgi:DNA-binding CsgD family transcriptional regulator
VPIDTAAMLLEREHELADFGRVLTAARGARGRVVLVEGDAGIDKTSLLQAASETAAAAGFRCLRARASELEREYAFGCVRRTLQEGLRLADRCGAHALAAQARTELRAAGGRSSAPAGSGVQQLTASERRVAELAAEGRSNPEIAQVLFVTRKTVETHLASVYRKLAIPGRGHLVRALAQPS